MPCLKVVVQSLSALDNLAGRMSGPIRSDPDLVGVAKKKTGQWLTWGLAQIQHRTRTTNDGIKNGLTMMIRESELCGGGEGGGESPIQEPSTRT